ncbi:MAG TPA: HAMP domain-containing sensor histidine kinase [Thermoanaerobaculia bacterium]
MADRLETLTAALIHRFNNVLMGIQPHVEVIKRAGKDNERVLGSATQIENALRRAKAVMSEVSRLARPLALDIQPMEITPWFDSLRRDVQPFATNPVSLTFDTPADLTIAADREQLTRVIVNLITNAVEAMPDGGTIMVSARPVTSGIELEIADSGAGIAPDLIGRAFEPLFTTKRNAAGLGLSVVQQIVEAHGGTVRLDSKPGAGTTVTFVLRRP